MTSFTQSTRIESDTNSNTFFTSEARSAHGRDFRRALASSWRRWRWFILFSMWLTSYVLACVGFHLFYPERRIADILYLAFQLHTFNTGLFGDLPWQLDTARWLMPLAGSFALLEAFGAIFRDRLREVRALSLRDHVVICGLSQKGLLLARSFRNGGCRVIIIENNASHDLLASCVESDVFTLIGDATQRETLTAARVAHAKYLIAVSDDAVNAAVIAHARHITSHRDTVRITALNRRNPILTCAAHIVDPELWRLLRRWEVNTNGATGGAMRLQLFNVFDIGARGLLSTQTLHTQTSHTQTSHTQTSHTRTSHTRTSHTRTSHTRTSHTRTSHTRTSHTRTSHTRTSHTRTSQIKTEQTFSSAENSVSSPVVPFAENSETERAPRLLVIGAGRLGQRVVIGAARQWLEQCQDEQPNDNTPRANNLRYRVLDSPQPEAEIPQNARLQIVLVDATASAVCDLLHQRHSFLSQVCDIQAHDLEIGSTEFHRVDLLGDEKHCSFSAIYICVGDETRALAATLLLRRQVEARGFQKTVHILVRTAESSGLTSLLNNTLNAKVSNIQNTNENQDQQLRAFGLLEYSCRLDLVLGGTSEFLARNLHENYLREQRRVSSQQASSNRRALVAWEQLPEDLREANRRQADFIGEQLMLEKCDIAPISDWEASPFAFTSEETERMASREHERWKSEQAALGFVLGARGATKKTNPYLVSWRDLSPDVQEMNRQTMRSLPEFLARAGFQVFRL